MGNLHISIDKKDTPTHPVVTTHTVICILTYNVNTSILHALYIDICIYTDTYQLIYCTCYIH